MIMNDDNSEENDIELVQSVVSACCDSRISISLNLKNCDMNVGLYDESDVLDSCSVVPLEGTEYELKLSKNGVRDPSCIESDFSCTGNGFEEDLSVKNLKNDNRHLICLIVYVIVLVVNHCILVCVELETDYFVAILPVLSVVYIVNAVFQICFIRQWIKTLLVIAFSSFFDGIAMVIVNGINNRTRMVIWYGMMILDGVVLFLIGLYLCYSSIKNSYDRDENVTHESSSDKEADHSYNGIVLTLLILIFMYLNRYAPFGADSSLMEYIAVSIVAIIIVFVFLTIITTYARYPEWMKILLTISYSMFIDGIAMIIITNLSDIDGSYGGIMIAVGGVALLVVACETENSQ